MMCCSVKLLLPAGAWEDEQRQGKTSRDVLLPSAVLHAVPVTTARPCHELFASECCCLHVLLKRTVCMLVYRYLMHDI